MRKLFLLFLLTKCALINAESWSVVTDRTSLQENKVYMFVSHKNSKYYLANSISDGTYGVHDAYYSEVRSASIYKYYTFQLSRIDKTYFNLYNILRQFYVNIERIGAKIVDKPQNGVASPWYADEQFIWAKSKTANGEEFSRVFTCKKGGIDTSCYGLYAESSAKKSDYNAPDIYELTELNLDDSKDFPAFINQFTVDDVKLNRTFVVDAYNTLILPCGVSQYKSVFGDNVKAYKYTSMVDGTVTLSEVTSSNLDANTPYLLVGSSFNSTPYSLGAKTVYPANTNITSDCVAGTYKSVNAKSGYLFTKNGIKKYDEDGGSSVTIQPYRWYLNTTIAEAKIKLVDNTSSAISNVMASDRDAVVYNLQGMKVANSSKELPSSSRGIYIIDGKKVVIP